jgi:Carboxypeptidase regulatory-like domain
MFINVTTDMKRNWIAFGMLMTAILGCGGVGAGSGSVAGLILDMNGNPVRGARVFVSDGTLRETNSNSSGSYRISGVSATDILIKAEYDNGSTLFRGENLARVFDQEQVNNHNIVLIPSNQIGSLQGRVQSSGGLRIQGARISAKPTNGSQLSSTQTVADDNGNFFLSGLAGGVTYQIQASFPGFHSADATRTVSAGNTLTINYSLGPNGDPLLPAPANLDAVAWTSPLELTRGVEQQRTMESIKKFIDPRYKKPLPNGRGTSTGSPVEVQLYWDRFDSLEILGYAIWRKRSSDPYEPADYLRDPLAESYLDSNINLRDGIQYSYVVSATNTNYPDTDNSLSDDSNAVSVTPLGDMNILSPTIAGNNVTFRWSAVPNAANYTIYVFDTYPGIMVSSFANNFNNPATGTQWTYNLAPLTSGHLYYYLIMGSNSNDSARTLSVIGSFTAP